MKKRILCFPFLLSGFLLFLTISVKGSVHGQDNASNSNEIDKRSILKSEIDSANSLVGNSIDSAVQYVDFLINKYAEKDDFSYARLLSLKSWFVSYRAEYEEGIKLAHKALKIQMKEGLDSLGIAKTLNRVGMVNLLSDRLDNCLEYFLLSLEYYQKIGNEDGVEMVYNNLGVFESERGNNKKVLDYYMKSLEIRKRKKKFFWMAYSYFNISNLYKEMEMKDSFEKYILLSKSTFENETKSGQIPAMVKMGLAEYYQLNGDLTEAIKYAQEGVIKAHKMSNTEVEVEAIRLLGNLFYENGSYKRAYETYDEFFLLKSKLDSVGNSAAIAEIEEKYKNAKNREEISLLNSKNLESENKLQRAKYFAILALLAGVLIAVLSAFFIFRKRQKEKLHQAAMKSKLEEVKLIALRSQMNPHFLFNCINTAQNFVLDTNKQEGYEYLEKFAKLLRIVLDSSSSLYVSIEDELKYIRLYLELESMRFSNEFKYNIHVDESLLNGVYEMPAMILQPFIENAVLHGIQNLENKNGLIEVSLKKDRGLLMVCISDNGVGRVKAQSIKDQKSNKYNSIAIPNVKERLQTMKQNGFSDVKIDIVDLEENSVSRGTQVNLTISLT